MLSEPQQAKQLVNATIDMRSNRQEGDNLTSKQNQLSKLNNLRNVNKAGLRPGVGRPLV